RSSDLPAFGGHNAQGNPDDDGKGGRGQHQGDGFGRLVPITQIVNQKQTEQGEQRHRQPARQQRQGGDEHGGRHRGQRGEKGLEKGDKRLNPGRNPVKQGGKVILEPSDGFVHPPVQGKLRKVHPVS